MFKGLVALNHAERYALSLRIDVGTFSIVLSPLMRCEAIGMFHRWLVGNLPLMVTSQTMG